MRGHESSRNIYPKRAQTKLDVCAALYVSAHNKLLIVIVGCRFARRINEQRANNAICHVYIQQVLVMYCKARRTLHAILFMSVTVSTIERQRSGDAAFFHA